MRSPSPSGTPSPEEPAFKTRARLKGALYALTAWDRYTWKGRPSQSPRFSRKLAAVEALQSASDFDAPRPAEPLAEVEGEGLSFEAFFDASDGYRRPVVLRGLARDIRAVRLWDAAYLRERLGGSTCVVLSRDQRSRWDGWDTGVPLEEIEFGELLDRMGAEELYLNNSSELVESCPALLADLELDRLRPVFTPPDSRWDELLTTNFFLGARHVYSSLHCAIGGNFFLNLVGRKQWTLVDPRYTAYVFPVPGRPFQYCLSYYGGYRVSAEKGELDDSILSRLPRFETVLEPGDVLYNAPWWWHEVSNLSDLTVGCAVRHTPRPFRHSPSWSNHAFFTAISMYPAFRALIFAHYLRQQVLGEAAPLRDFLNTFQMKLLYRGLQRRRS